MHSTESEQQEPPHDIQRNFLTEFRLSWAHRAHHFSPSNLWSQTVNFVTENSTSIHLLSLFVVFLIVQTAHVRNANKLKADLATFLVENEVITNIDQDVSLSAFMEQYDCHSEISCLEVIRVGAFAQPAAAATASSGSQLQQQQHPRAAAAEHALPSNDHWFDHVSEQNAIERKAALTWPPHHIDLTQSATLLKAAFERKEELIVDHFLQTHSVPSVLTARLKQNLDIKTLNDLIALLSSITGNSNGDLQSGLSPADRKVLLANLGAPLTTLTDLSSSGQSAKENFVRRLRVRQWSACLEEDKAHFWTLGKYL